MVASFHELSLPTPTEQQNTPSPTASEEPSLTSDTKPGTASVNCLQQGLAELWDNAQTYSTGYRTGSQRGHAPSFLKKSPN